MKTPLKFFVCAITLIAFSSFSGNLSAKPKSETLSVQTSAVCGSCKNRVEKALIATNGVEKATLNLKNKTVKVKYDPAKTSPDQIRHAIANTGYDADDVKKNEEAFNKLPHCCRPNAGGCMQMH